MEKLNIPMPHSNTLRPKAVPPAIPDNVPCPCRCTFCYETKFTKLFPWIKTKYILPYTDETFNLYLKLYKESKFVLAGGTPFKKAKNELQYFPEGDFFSLGLTDEQIEILIQNYKDNGCTMNVYTTGFNTDFKLIKRFSSKYPGLFRVHLSIVTFDSAIRKNIMNPDIDIKNIKKICEVLIKPDYFLLYFNKRQIISDIEILNKFSIRNNGKIYVHRLYYNKLSPKYIADYSKKGEKEFEETLYYLKINDKGLKGISKRLTFSPHSKIYAWAWREEIKKLLQICKGTASEAIFCSYGTYQVIKKIVGQKVHVVPLKGCFGGCVDFTLGITVKAILLKIKETLAKGVVLEHIYLPSPMFCVEGKYDLNGDGIELIKKTYPKIGINVIKIPTAILESTVSLDTCIRYYLNKRLGNLL